MGAGAYLRTQLGLLLRSRVVLGMLVLVAVICVGSSLLPGTTGFCPELYHRRRALFDDAVKSGVISPQTSEQANLLLEYDVALVALEQVRPDLTGDWHSFTADAAHAAEVAIRVGESGLCAFGAGGVGSEADVRAELALTRALHDGGWDVYASTAEQPATFRLAAVPSLLPGALWTVPTLVIACVLGFDRSSGRLLAQAPMEARTARVIDSSIAWVAGMLVTVLGWGLAAAVAARNGLGSLDYPVVMTSDAAPCVSNVGASIASNLARLALSSLVMSLLSSAASLGRNPWAPTAAVGGTLVCACLASGAPGSTASGAIGFLGVMSSSGTATYPGDASWLANAPTTPTEVMGLLSVSLLAYLASFVRARRHVRGCL